MTMPTWAGWPALIAARKADVTTPGPKYIGRWDTDYRDWVPEVYETGIQWNHVVDPTYGDIELNMTLTEGPNQFKDLWKPVGEETTEWREVPYPK